MGSVSMREHRDCFAYVLRNKPSPPSSRMRLAMDTDHYESTPSKSTNNLLQAVEEITTLFDLSH
jgi:hypothetical protein